MKVCEWTERLTTKAILKRIRKKLSLDKTVLSCLVMNKGDFFLSSLNNKSNFFLLISKNRGFWCYLMFKIHKLRISLKFENLSYR